MRRYLGWVLKKGKDWICRENEGEGVVSRGDNMNIGMDSGSFGEY